MKAEQLKTIDTAFYLPYRFLRFLFTISSKLPASSPSGPVIIIKFMGLGSITRFASLCDRHQVDYDRVVLVTFETQRELCHLLGFKTVWYVRTSGSIHFIMDCFMLILKAWKIRPAFLIDFERCSMAVGTLRLMMAFGSKGQVLCFEDTTINYAHNRLSVHAIKGLTMESMFMIGVEKLSKGQRGNREVTLNIQNKKILVNINASNYSLARRYARESFEQLVEMLHLENSGLEFYFTGSDNEFKYVNGLVEPLRAKGITVFNTAGRRSLTSLSNELATCRLFITCDSGPLHLAVALGTPTVAIWGPTQPTQFGYQQLPQLKNCSSNLSCSPCLHHLHSEVARFCHGKISCMLNYSLSNLFIETQALLATNEFSRKVCLLPGMLNHTNDLSAENEDA